MKYDAFGVEKLPHFELSRIRKGSHKVDHDAGESKSGWPSPGTDSAAPADAADFGPGEVIYVQDSA